jgi:hypothetical protein
MKTHTKLWLTAAALFLFLQCLAAFVFNTIDWADPLDLFTFGTDFLTELLLITIIGFALGALLACFPFQNKTYKEKTPNAMPIGVITVLCLLLCAFGYTWQAKNANGLEYSTVKYGKIKIPDNLNCSEIHEGKFETETLIIERSGKTQTQTHKKTGKTQTFSIAWKSDCEYALSPLYSSKTTLEAKIVSVSPNIYTCYVQPANSLFRFPYFLKVEQK